MNMMIPAPEQAQPTQFEFSFDGAPIRGIATAGKPVFVAADLAKALHYRDAANLVRVVRAHERGTHSVSTPGGVQRMTTITESGMYRAVMARKIADDRDVVLRRDIDRFQDWVVEEVLPQIRMTGSYAAPAPEPVDPLAFLSNPHNVMQLVAQYAQRTIALEGQVAERDQQLAVAHSTIEEQAVTVEAHERLTNIEGGKCVSSTAKRLGVKPMALFAYMRDPRAKVRWLIKRSPRSEDEVFQERLNAKDMLSPVETIKVGPEGEQRDKDVTRILVTPRGLGHLARLIVEGKDPLLPVPVDMLHVLKLSRAERGLFE
ncbi:BRO family protein [Methylorubrum sp. DB1722]|uniref:BRO family protein n=1 Tax=Methylorubrum sp. DB1722 TaxID=2478916 RepID=UPI0018E29BAB|nr:BRO family protein [Methylorubrum sp. DB1722]MBI1689501.1 hypothetical protein [Methylorubrum sp. DB1722]